MAGESLFPKSKSWVWNDHRGELVKISQDGRPASPSASSSTSRRFSPAPGQKHPSREAVVSKRVVEAQYGRLDLGEWECDANSPVTFQDCVKVALHLQALETPLSKLFLEVVKLEKVQKLLRGLVEYFAELFVQADLVQSIAPPAVANQRLLQQRWERRLSQVLHPLSATYVQLILGHGLNQLHHMKRGRSLQSLGVRDNHIFERLYELAELLVWVTFRRRDRPVIHAEVTRLFRGAHHNHHHQQPPQQGEEVGADVPSYTAPTTTTSTSTAATTRRRRKSKEPPLSSVVRESCGLLLRQLPELSLTKSISVLAGDALGPLTYVSESEGVRGRGLWVLGARRADLNEYLEPAAEEGDQLSLLD
ncbi:protein phosphatase 1 regulatory subunit 36-like [Eriocheir sinensis]|uniref:protein phosphatase 1 regulatory subunit 36-like n=1 Tax=Eriocheir sinensis TaxID=95602 RepID=UPI0021C77A0E|nr:protein phosphatase 1 regulatory subunit 36-like [Eriocheir sinensis]